jgi:hypothetical protein
MDLAIGLLALVVAVVALGVVLRSGGQLNALSGEVSALHRDLEHAQRELGELKAATAIAPAPPLPKARTGGLDDLREQLRAAHREAGDTAEE